GGGGGGGGRVAARRGRGKKMGFLFAAFPGAQAANASRSRGDNRGGPGRADGFAVPRLSESTQGTRGHRRIKRYSSKPSRAFCRAGVATAACGGPASAAPPGATAMGRLPASTLSEGRRGLTAPAAPAER